jgi:hypothetical protein
MDIKHKIICDYRSAANSPKELLNFLLSNYRDICKYHSFNTFKEMTINYRIIFDRKNRSKIIKDYEKYVLTKKEFHKSNLAISYNMIDQIKVNKGLEKKIVDFMYDQMQDSDLNKFRQINNATLKKHMIMNYIHKKYFDKR